MAHFPDYMDPTETRICNRIITKALNAGHFIRVNHGEGWMTGWTRDRAEIQKATAATDQTYYHVADQDGDNWLRLGWIWLVHGNGEDVVSDLGAKTGDNLDYLETLTE